VGSSLSGDLDSGYRRDSTPALRSDHALDAQLTERILSADPATGVASRILRFAPGTDTTPNGVQIHDFWEEVYILEGSLTDLELGETFTAGMYACRPPGMKHGPWTSDNGCLTFEVRYSA
jgi:ChrR Cupin-like domain